MDKGRSQIQMLLMQQAGPGVLSLSSLASDELTGFLRKTENLVTQERLAPVIVYWSSKDAGPLLPEEKRLRELKRESFFLATFSEGREEGHEELCFLVQSQELCLIAYSLEERYQSGNPLYKSAGSVDPQVVGQCFSTMLPLWQFIDLGQANGLEEALINLGQTASTPALVQSCRRNWPVVKMPIRPTKEWEVLESAYSARLKSGELPLQALLEEGLEAGLLSPGPSKASPAGLPGGVDAGDGEASVTAPREMKPAEAMPCREAVKPHARQARPAEREAVIPLAAQQIIREMISQLRHSDDISAILQLAIERLTRVTGAHRGLIWQVIGEEELTVTNEYSAVGRNCFAGEELGHEESTAIVVEFLARFPDESGGGVISVSDTIKDTRLRKLSPGLSSMLEMAEVRARLVCQLRCRGVFSGFVELQECRQPRQWSEAEADVLQSVAEVLSVVVQQSHDQSKIELDAREMKLINEISSLFRESKGQKSQDMLIKSVRRVAEHTSFERCQIYLFDAEAEELVPQIVDSSNGASPVSLADKESPFVVVYQTGREKSFNPIYARKPDAYFGKDFALVVPLVSESEKVGVLALWKRAADAPAFKPKEQQLAKVVSGQLAAHIRADRAIAQIRADQAREHLINKVSDQIRESLKQVDQIMETLVESLASHFELSFCAVSLFDEQSGKFVMTKRAGGEEEFSPDDGSDGKEDASPSELISVSMLEELKQGKMIFLKAGELKRKLRRLELGLPSGARSVTLVPLIYGGEFKAALCMVSDTRTRPWPVKDRKMVKDLADRVAVVASHAELFAQVEQQAVTDPMTGLFNRRHFTQQLSREIDRFQRFGHPFSYVIVDLDFLKMINDTLGHQYGDVAIKHIAAVLKRTTRDVDTTARYGGEEFVVLLPETDAIAARLVAQRICNALKEKPVSELSERKTELEEKIAAAVDSDKIGDADAERLRSCIVTASIGVATFPTDAQERERLAELADQALYLAKHRGRNQVCSVSEDLIPSLKERGEEALEIQKAAIKARAEEMASIDIKLIAEHGILGILGAIIKIIEARDAYSKERSPRAAEYASKLAQSLHLSKEHVTIISLAAILHNVGKIALPEEILKKRGPLTEDERKIIEQSPSIGKKMLEPAKHLHRVASVIEAYHEHWDGTGYPRRLKGDEIPLESRIVALVDAYVAMTSDRPYRKALSHEEALKIIGQGAGKDWDPRLVKLFLTILSKEKTKVRFAS